MGEIRVRFPTGPFMDSKRAVKQLKALQHLVKGKEPRLAAEQSAKWKVLISTILSSQTKDTTTNKISEILYKKYKNPKALANAPLASIKRIIRPINFYKTKAAHIKGNSKANSARHSTNPRKFDETSWSRKKSGKCLSCRSI